VLTYDIRNHGNSGAANGGLSGIGQWEWRDCVGAKKYVDAHPRLRQMKAGLYSQCMGGNSQYQSPFCILHSAFCILLESTLDFGLQPADFRLGLVKEQPTLETDRLLLRPLLLQEDLFVRELANNPSIDSMNIWPLHGYGRKMVRRWIGFKRVAWKDGTAAEFGIELKSGGELVGLVGLDSIDAAHASAELSFLLHERFWGQGYATEAAARHPATLNSQPSTLNRCGAGEAAARIRPQRRCLPRPGNDGPPAEKVAAGAEVGPARCQRRRAEGASLMQRHHHQARRSEETSF